MIILTGEYGKHTLEKAMLPRVVDPRQIEADAEAGKLDQLAEEALAISRREVHPAIVKLGTTLSPKFFDTYRHLPPT